MKYLAKCCRVENRLNHKLTVGKIYKIEVNLENKEFVNCLKADNGKYEVGFLKERFEILPWDKIGVLLYA